MWEMFDFGHVKSHKYLKKNLQHFIKTADEPTLRLALKGIQALKAFYLGSLPLSFAILYNFTPR